MGEIDRDPARSEAEEGAQAPSGLGPNREALESLEQLRRRVKGSPSQLQEALEDALEQLAAALGQMQVAEAELWQQNEELAAAHTLIDAERRRYQELFELAPEAYVLTDPDGNIEELNQPASRLLGRRSKALSGKPLVSYVDPKDRRIFRQQLVRLSISLGRIDGWQFRLRSSTGESIPVTATVEAVPESDRSVAGLRWVIRESLPAGGVQEQMAQRRSMLESQSEASAEGILVVDASGAIVSFNRRLVEMWGISETVLAARSDEAALAVMAEEVVSAAEFVERVAYLYANPAEEGHDEISLKDGRVFERYTAPLKGTDGDSFGRVWFFRDASEERLRERQADELVASAEAARTEAEAVSDRLRKLGAITDVMIRHAGLEELLAGLLDAVRQALSTDTATILLLTPDGKNLAVRAVSGEEPEVRGEIRVALGQGIAGTIASERLPRIVDDVPRAGPHSQALRSKVKSLVGVPLMVEDRVVGVVHSATFTQHRFTEEDVHLLELVAERAAVAIENAGLYESAKEARRDAEEAAARTQALQSVTGALSEALTPDEVADAVVREGMSALDAAAGLLALVTAEGTELEIARATNYPPEMVQRWRRFPIDGRFPLSEAVRTGLPVLLTSTAAREARFPDLRATLDLPDHSLAAVPMFIEGRALGGIVFRFDEPRGFDEQDVAFMESLAKQSAQALERARLYEGERRARATSEMVQLRLAFLAEAGAILSGSLRISDALESLARLSLTSLTDLCLIDLVEEDGSIRRVAALQADPEKQHLADLLRTRYVPDPSGPHPAVRVMQTGRSEFAEEMSEDFLRRTTQDEDHLRIVQAMGFQSFMCVPLMTRGRAIGTFTLVSCSPERRYGPADVALAEELAMRAALAMDNAGLYRDAIEARRQAEAAAERTAALQSVSAALAEALTPAEVAEVIVERGLSTLSAAAGSILLVTPDRTELVLVRAFGYPEDSLEQWHRFPIDSEAPLAQAARTAEPVFTESREEASAHFPTTLGNTTTAHRSWAAIPLIVDGRTIGAMGLSFGEAREFTEEVRTFIDALARQCAQALERARLYEAERSARAEAEEAENRLSFLAEASEVLASSLDVEVTLASVARLAVPSLADWCTIDLLREDGSIQQVAMSHRDPAKEALAHQLRERYPPQREPPHTIWKVLLSGEAEMATDIYDHELVTRATDPLHVKLLRQVGIRSHIVVPLRARGRTLGAISFIVGDARRAYGPEDLALAEDLGRRAAVAVDNARLYELQRNIAWTLQRSLLPARLPEIPGAELAARYRAAGEGNEVGGDFYDAFEVADGSWILTIGDVCGKGPEAAAVTGLARHTLRAVAFQEPRPSRMLALLNEAILREVGDERFCTVGCLRLRTSPTGIRVTVCSGGHPLPLVLRSDGSLETAGGSSTLLGVLPDVELNDHALDLHPGDAIVLYTDGVIEEDRAATELGTERLARIIQACAGFHAAAIAECVERSVTEYGPGSPRDDVAVLVLRVKNEG